MVARYDKYDPISGGFRAALAADWLKADEGVPIGVGLDADGHVVKGAGNTGVVAVLVVDKTASATIKHKLAGDIVDCMTSGEIVDVESLIAGTAYYAAAAGGALSATAPASGVNGVKVGHTVEADRLVVRTGFTQGAGL